MNMQELTHHLKILFDDDEDLKRVSISALKLQIWLKGRGVWHKELATGKLEKLREHIVELLEAKGYGLIKHKDVVCGVAYFGRELNNE